MYENFELNYPDLKLTGYLWDVDNPKYVMTIIHGIGEYIGRYDRMAKVLNESGIAVLGMDLPGHGLSDGKRGETSPRDKILNIISLMIDRAEELYPGVPIIMYGHSMGGNLCLDFKSRGPKNHVPIKYIVSAPWLRLVNEIPGPAFYLIKGVSRVLPGIQISSGCKGEDLGNIVLTSSYDTDPLVHPYITIRTAADCIDVAKALLKGNHMNNGMASDKPFLLMHGSGDKICDVTGSRDLAKLYDGKDNFTYIEWDGYYHEIHNGGPDAMGDKVIETIRDFIID